VAAKTDAERRHLASIHECSGSSPRLLRPSELHTSFAA
jgi:hypothetical protein